MKIPNKMLKEIRKSGYNKKLIHNYIRELLDREKENNNLELIDNYLLDNDLKEPTAEIMMAADLIDEYALDKRFMRELEDRDQYEAA